MAIKKYNIFSKQRKYLFEDPMFNTLHGLFYNIFLFKNSDSSDEEQFDYESEDLLKEALKYSKNMKLRKRLLSSLKYKSVYRMRSSTILSEVMSWYEVVIGTYNFIKYSIDDLLEEDQNAKK